jgi:hypothetical protein
VSQATTEQADVPAGWQFATLAAFVTDWPNRLSAATGGDFSEARENNSDAAPAKGLPTTPLGSKDDRAPSAACAAATQSLFEELGVAPDAMASMYYTGDVWLALLQTTGATDSWSAAIPAAIQACADEEPPTWPVSNANPGTKRMVGNLEEVPVEGGMAVLYTSALVDDIDQGRAQDSSSSYAWVVSGDVVAYAVAENSTEADAQALLSSIVSLSE